MGIKVEKENSIKRILNLIAKDTGSRNESKKLIVVIRVILLSIVFYFLANLVLCNKAFHDVGSMVCYAVFFLIFTGLFVLSYYIRTIYTLWLFNIGIMGWIAAIVHYFGWNIGVQHFLMMLLLLYFFSSYNQYTAKIVFAVLLCAYRLLLFGIYQDRIPVWQLSSVEENTMQILNTITIFWCISVISYVFSKDSQELEGKLVEYNNQLMRQANTDTLTGLFNRRRAMEYLTEMVHQSQNPGFSLCMCDIDFFKKVNDNYGHDFGDEVLKEVARILREEQKGKNMAARLGGEEFLLVFPECNGDDAYLKVEAIRKKIKETKVERNGKQVGVTMTFGLTEYDFQNGIEATLKEADEKLYIGKEKGRDIIIF